MPLTIPPFVQYQAPLFPLRGLWNRPPPEGDKFVNIEIDWQAGGGAGNAVQISLSGNSPVAISQIVALSVDNGRCSVDVHFIFPDSGFQLTVPAFNQGVFPVFTNALMFYVSAPGAALGDLTLFEVLNSMPPPVPIPSDLTQTVDAVALVSLSANADTQILPVTKFGLINSLSLVFAFVSVGTASVQIQDGNGFVIWFGTMTANAAGQPLIVNLSDIRLRFQGGIKAHVAAATFTGQSGMTVNIYYTAIPGAP